MRVALGPRFSGLQNSRNLMKLAKFGFLGVVGIFVLAVIVLPLMAFSLPSPDKVIRREGFSTKILDRNGKPLYDIFEEERRTPIKIQEMPVYLKQEGFLVGQYTPHIYVHWDAFQMNHSRTHKTSLCLFSIQDEFPIPPKGIRHAVS